MAAAAHEREEVVLLSEQPEWSDVQPIPQCEGVEPVVQILYDKEYSDAMGLLRAVMRRGELSQRTLHLTSVIIFMNSAHFTVWEFRRCILHSLNSKREWISELDFMKEVNSMNTKNYQLWNHRRVVAETLMPSGGSGNGPALKVDTIETYTLKDEFDHLGEIFAEDAKHYHAWAHRQWLVRTYGCWDKEMTFTKELIKEDVYNNSAWNHRFYVIMNGFLGDHQGGNDDVFVNEVMYCLECLKGSEENESVWSFLLGLLLRAIHVGTSQYLQVLEILFKFVKVTQKQSKTRAVRCVFFDASLCYQLALRVLGHVKDTGDFWKRLDLDAAKLLHQAVDNWRLLKSLDPTREASYEIKEGLAKRLLLVGVGQ